MTSRRPAAAALAILVPLALGSLRAQDAQNPPSPLRHDIVVTATRIETPEKKVGSSITVIRVDELVRTGKAFVLDALESVLGLSTVRAGGPGAAASVFVRGAGSEQTLFLLDGLELNDPMNPARSYDVSHLSLSQVERVEILRGPQGLLWGSDALGGVVNIITRAGHGRPRVSLGAAADSLSSLTADVSVAGSSKKTDYAFSLFQDRTAGISAAASSYGNTEKDGYRNLSLDARFGYAASPAASLTFTLRGTTDRTDLDDFGGPGGDDPNNVQTYGSLLLNGHYRGLSSGGHWERTVSVSWIGTRREYDNPVDEAHPTDSDHGLFHSGLVKLDWQNNFVLCPTHTLTAGLELENEYGQSKYVSESAYGPYEEVVPSVHAGSGGLYVLDHWETGGRFFITAGVRTDDHSRAGSAVTFRVAPAYLIPATGTRFKATLGSGFKSPSLYQLFAPASSYGPVGNPLLQPERVLGWDAGVEQSLAGGRALLSVAWFEDSFRDLIDFAFGSGYINIGRARTQGLEVTAEARPSGSSRLLASYTRLSAHDLGAGTELLRRPRDKFSAEAGLSFLGQFDLAADALWVGRRLDVDTSDLTYPTVAMPSYVLLNLVVTKTFGSGFEVFARVDNLLNAQYQTIWGYGSPGITFRTGFRLTL